MTSAPPTELPDHGRPVIAARRGRSRWFSRLSIVLAVLGVTSLLVGGAVMLRDASLPLASGGVVVGADAFRVAYVDAPSSLIVGYRHGDAVRYAMELTNEGPLPITVEELPLGELRDEKRLFDPTGVTLAPPGATPSDVASIETTSFEPFTLGRGASRTVVVEGVFYNCAYYTERAVDVISALPVTWQALGMSSTSQIELPDQLAIRSPYLRVCPGRVMDRSAATRTGGG